MSYIHTYNKRSVKNTHTHTVWMMYLLYDMWMYAVWCMMYDVWCMMYYHTQTQTRVPNVCLTISSIKEHEQFIFLWHLWFCTQFRLNKPHICHNPIIHRTSYIIPSYIMHHTSYIIHHTSYIIHHTHTYTHIPHTLTNLSAIPSIVLSYV